MAAALKNWPTNSATFDRKAIKRLAKSVDYNKK
jgi:hypothetical protein